MRTQRAETLDKRNSAIRKRFTELYAQGLRTEFVLITLVEEFFLAPRTLMEIVSKNEN